MTAAPQVDVLLVEDDRVVTEILLAAMRDAGLTTDVAGDVVEAKRLLARGNYNVLVLDLILPDGTGFDILAFMKTTQVHRAPIIVITAADPTLLRRLDRSVVKVVMFKPLDTQQVVQTIRTSMRS